MPTKSAFGNRFVMHFKTAFWRYTPTSAAQNMNRKTTSYSSLILQKSALLRYAVLLALWLTAISGFAQNAPSVIKNVEKKSITLKPVINNAFKRGEKVTFRVHYGWLTAGVATMSVAPDIYKVNDRNCYRLEVTGTSSGLIKQITEIRDVWGAFADTAAIMPHKYYRSIKENSFIKTEEIMFDYPDGLAHVSSSRPPVGEVVLKDNTLDMITGYYYLRLLDYDSMQPETLISLTGIFETQLYSIKIRYKGKERIKTPLGYINTIRLQPIMPENGVFAGENSVKFYISDDANRIPIKIRAELFVGGVELDIEKFEGLRHPIRFDKKR